MTRRLLILHDSPDFGGHERMLLDLLPAALGDNSPFDETVFYAPASNVRLDAALRPLSPGLEVRHWPFVKNRGEPYLHRFRWSYRAAVRRALASVRPDTVLLVQGRIEHLAVPMSVLPTDTRVVSYLPMAHRLADMGRTGRIGDKVRRRLYRRPDHFIVPSEAVAQQVADAGGISPVTVTPNVVALAPNRSQMSARQTLGLPGDGRIALFLGRLDPLQKGLDRLLAAIARAGAARLRDWTFVFVGDGPGRAMIEDGAALGVRQVLVPWTDDPGAYLAAADVMLLPSRWEGVPLVMLEAMQAGLPILASPIDTCRLHLPAGNLVDFDMVDLPAALASVTAPAAVVDYREMAASLLKTQTLDASRASFLHALTGDAAT